MSLSRGPSIPLTLPQTRPSHNSSVGSSDFKFSQKVKVRPWFLDLSFGPVFGSTHTTRLYHPHPYLILYRTIRDPWNPFPNLLPVDLEVRSGWSSRLRRWPTEWHSSTWDPDSPSVGRSLSRVIEPFLPDLFHVRLQKKDLQRREGRVFQGP